MDKSLGTCSFSFFNGNLDSLFSVENPSFSGILEFELD